MSTYPYFDYTSQYFGTGPDDPRTLGISNLSLRDGEAEILAALHGKLAEHQKGNQLKQLYYEAKQIVEHLEIGVPRHLSNIGVAVGWAGTTVDALDERIDFLAWVHESGNLQGLDEVFIDNDLAVESGGAHVDALTVGTGLASVGVDLDDPSRVRVQVESSYNSTLIWDYARRRSFAGLSRTVGDETEGILMETLYLQNSTILFMRDPVSNVLKVVQRDDHNKGRCFITRLPNRSRPYQVDGRSEISAAVRYNTDAAVRTMLGMEVNREFYVAPQRFVLNAQPSDFGVTADMSPEDKYRRGLSLAMGMMNIIPPRPDNTEGDPPSVVEFRPAPPTPFIEQVKAYSIQMSAETGLPAETFGFVTDNPTSGDAIVKADFRVARRSSRRIGSFATGWKEVGLLSQLARGKDVDNDFMRGLRCKFANPMMPTPAATADEIQKMVASNVLVPNSSVTYELYGRMDERMIAQLEKDKLAYEADQERKAAKEARRAATTAAAAAPDGQGPENGNPSATKRPPAEERSE